jgi:DNA mismatch repair protein MutL
MKDRVILHAIRQAFEGMIDEQSYPAFALFIEMPPDQLDVNVHPAKHEVRFHQSRIVHDLIFKSISDALLRSSSDDYMQGDDSDNITHGYGQQQSEPQRDYVASLQTQSRPSGYSGAGAGGGSGRLSQYMPQRPSVAETKSYANLVQSNPDSTENNKFAQQGLQVLLAPNNQVILCVGNELKCTSLSNIGAAYLETLIEQSSVNQPLLMPVSVVCKSEGVVDLLEQLSLEVSTQNKRIILKKVPSTLRQLAWLQIFPQLIERIEESAMGDSNSPEKQVQEIEKVRILISDLWCASMSIGMSDLQHWLSCLGETRINAVFENAISFQLPLLDNGNV